MDLYKIRKEINLGIPLTNINLRVTDYVRVSTDKDTQKKSLQNQIEHFEEFIKQNSHWTYVKGYVDEGITGTSDVKRENFMQMINDAKNDKFDLIITKEISRFSRNTLDSIKYTRELLNYGVGVFFVNDNINTILPDAELRLTIMSSMAQDEIRRLSERVKFGMNRAINRGEILGNDLLYGYKKDKDTGNLKIIKEEAIIVNKIFSDYAISKLSLSKIVKNLNNLNIKTNMNKNFSITTISRMIENPKYKGYYCGKKTEVIDYMTKKIKYFKENDWIMFKNFEKIPPIISNELWEMANKRLKSRKKVKSLNNNYLYSNKLFCQNCKSVFHRRIFRKNNKDVSWVCANYLKNGKDICNSAIIRENELMIILEDIINLLEINNQEIINKLCSFYKTDKTNDNNNEIKKEIEEIRLKKDKLLDLSLKNMITNKEFKNKNNELNEQIKLLEISLKNNKEFDNKKIINYLNSNQNKIKEYIIESILNKIEILKKLDNLYQLNIYLNYQNKEIINKSYEFKRGYDVIGTKRYDITYQVQYYFR